MKSILHGNIGRLNEDLNEYGRGVIHSAALHGCAETISWVFGKHPGRLKLDKQDSVRKSIAP